MSLNQQLTEPRVSTHGLIPGSRMFTFMALAALAAMALLASGCQTSDAVEEAPAARAPAPAPDQARDPADDMTATEAAIAGLNDAPTEEAPANTAQLIRPDAPMSYSVKRGDTLWDIAAVFLKDPWFWPEIWQINPQVENPHLIYPGDVLSLAYGANGDARVMISQYSGARLQPRLRSEALDGPIDTIPFSAIAAFLSKPSVLTKDQALQAPHILAFRDQHMIGGTGHEIYVRNLNAGLNQRYIVMNVGDPIRDLDSREVLGYQATYVATAVVNAPGEVSKAMLTEGAREALEGDRLIEQEGEVPLTFTPHAPTSPIDGQIIAIADEATQIGRYQVVVLNRGNSHGLAPGAVLAIDQRGAVVADRYGKSPWKKAPFGKKVQLPYERAGTLIVFKTFDRISYGLVIGARSQMRVADRVYNP
jgi:LysM repeat protein